MSDRKIHRSVALPESMWNALKRIADEERRSVTAQIEVLLIDALRERDREKAAA